MKRTSYLILLLLLASLSSYSQNQSGEDSTGLPGDNFSLQGALQMFQQANSIEEFEKLLNTQSNHVNNLDLNADGEIDYIRVIDKADKDVHAFVLQVPVSENESQDIAVIELEKTGTESAMIQIVGDEDIYGEEVIVEPDGGEESSSFNLSNSQFSGPNAEAFINTQAIVVNVWLWPCVRFVYGPLYRPWVSPWRWRYYPVWWKPWHPFAWVVWHPFRVVYHRPFVIVHTHRVVRAHAVYRPYRVTSVSVITRHSIAIGNYRVTRSKTTVTGPRGNTTIKKNTTVKGPRGHVKAKKTTVKRRG